MAYHCDWCGEEIVSKFGMATVEIQGVYERGGLDGLINDTSRHFHCGDVDDDTCLLQAIRMMDQAGRYGGGRAERQRSPWERWCETPKAERKHRILNALGEDACTTPQLAKRINAADPELNTKNGDGLRSLLQELLDAGEVERSKNSQRWWLYRRRSVLGAEIKALQRTLDETAGA